MGPVALNAIFRKANLQVILPKIRGLVKLTEYCVHKYLSGKFRDQQS